MAPSRPPHPYPTTGAWQLEFSLLPAFPSLLVGSPSGSVIIPLKHTRLHRHCLYPGLGHHPLYLGYSGLLTADKIYTQSVHRSYLYSSMSVTTSSSRYTENTATSQKSPLAPSSQSQIPRERTVSGWILILCSGKGGGMFL